MSAAPRVFIAQRNFAVGDLRGNRNLLAQDAENARKQGASVLLSAELSLTGYSPEDLLHDSEFVSDARAAAELLAKEIPPELPLLAGLPWRENDSLYNAAALLRGGKVESVYRKNHLPNFSVFDERRHFAAGADEPLVFEADGVCFAAQICQDIWARGQAERVRKSGGEIVLCPNGSPYYWGKHRTRIEAARAFARESGAAVVYAHGAGGQDELVFDGGSFSVSADGKLTSQLPFFAESGAMVNPLTAVGNPMELEPDEMDSLKSAIVMALRDFARKNGFGGFVLGLSGGWIRLWWRFWRRRRLAGAM